MKNSKLITYKNYKSLQVYNGLPKIGNKIRIIKEKRKGNFNYIFGNRVFGNYFIYKKLKKNHPMYKIKKIIEIFDLVSICVSYNTVNFTPIKEIQQIYDIEQNAYIACFSKQDNSYIGQFRYTYYLLKICEFVNFYSIDSNASILARTNDGHLYDIRDKDKIKRINNLEKFIQENKLNDERISTIGVIDELQSTIG